MIQPSGSGRPTFEIDIKSSAPSQCNITTLSIIQPLPCSWISIGEHVSAMQNVDSSQLSSKLANCYHLCLVHALMSLVNQTLQKLNWRGGGAEEGDSIHNMTCIILIEIIHYLHVARARSNLNDLCVELMLISLLVWCMIHVGVVNLPNSCMEHTCQRVGSHSAYRYKTISLHIYLQQFIVYSMLCYPHPQAHSHAVFQCCMLKKSMGGPGRYINSCENEHSRVTFNVCG